MSKIQWTDETWNPIVGCSVTSPGCTNCYAMRMAGRLEAMARSPMASHIAIETHYAGTTRQTKAGSVWTGKIAIAPDETLLKPLRWRKPRKIFVNSMGDIFHPSVPDEAIDRVWAVMATTPRHTYQVLTKHPDRMRQYLTERPEIVADAAYYLLHSQAMHIVEREMSRLLRLEMPLPNVWIGTSAEDQRHADERVPHLLETPAARRFVSLEPLLGPIHLGYLGWNGQFVGRRTGLSALTGGRYEDGEYIGRVPRLDWVIAGGESGPRARPMHPDWALSLREQCAAAGVPFFFKQWGEWGVYTPAPCGGLGADIRAGTVSIVHPSGRDTATLADTTGGQCTEPGSVYMARRGTHSTGRLLDGVTHDAMPEPVQ